MPLYIKFCKTKKRKIYYIAQEAIVNIAITYNGKESEKIHICI